MLYTNSLLVLALSAAGLVSAHGNVQQVTGNLGGNGTALGIQGAAVPRFGKNAATEKDTTVFKGTANKPLTDGLGKTAANGALKVADITGAMALSGQTLPQVSNDGSGTITGTWRTVTSDGTANDKNGNLFAVLDTTGTGKYSQGTQLVATSNMVGNGKGNVVQRAVENILRALGKRATNVGADAAFEVKIPAGTTCTGSDAASGVNNFCLLKVVNNNNAGPFGGNVAFQIGGAAGAAPATPAATPAAAAAAKSAKTAKGSKNGKNAKRFEA